MLLIYLKILSIFNWLIIIQLKIDILGLSFIEKVILFKLDI